MRQLIKSIEFETLYQGYSEVLKNLNEVYRNENDVSSQERVFLSMFSSFSKLVPIRNMWIGRRNIDFLFPQLKLTLNDKTYLGIAIEINGGIHNSEFKMKKDTFKDKALLEINIFPISLDTDIPYNNGLKILESVSQYQSSDSRGRKRVLRKIYIKTILANRTNDQLFELFSYKNARSLISMRNSFNAFCGQERMEKLLGIGDNHGK